MKLSAMGQFGVLVALASAVVVVEAGLSADRKEVNKSGEVEILRDQAYAGGEGKGAERQRLDLYLPKGRKGFPVLVFLHGGGFTKGDRKDLSSLGETLARQGVAVAAVGYRLSPEVKHPAQVQDAARAVAWVSKNVARHGGQADQLFLGGHSAGALLAALLGSDQQYLEAEGLSLKEIRGVIALSGGYRVPEARKEIFGDEESRRKASPLNHAGAGLPPFFLAYADKDNPGQDASAREFADALKGKSEAVLFEAKDRDHRTLLSKISDGDATGEAILTFIRNHAGTGGSGTTR